MTQIELDRDRAIISACKKYNSIDWEQRRYEIAKEVLANFIPVVEVDSTKEKVASYAVQYADALIAELKKGKE